MATGRFHVCPGCDKKVWARQLFGALLAMAKGDIPQCPSCGVDTQLHLSFPYGLGAGHGQFVVIDAFLPDKPVAWQDKGRDVTFYPFLVIKKDPDGGEKAWLPYWHVVREQGTQRAKYGQWAPSMELSTLEELIAKARAKGYQL